MDFTAMVRNAAGAARSMTMRDLPGAKSPNRKDRISPIPLGSSLPASDATWKLTSGRSTMTRAGFSKT